MLTFRRRKWTDTDIAIFRRWVAIGAPVAVVEIVGRYDRRRRAVAVAEVPNGNEDRDRQAPHPQSGYADL